MMFVEGKWLYNYLVNNIYENQDFDLFKFNPLSMKTVIHKDKNKNDIESEFRYLPSSVKQTIVKQVVSSLKTLKTLRTKGFQKHGRLNFISELTSINLKQYGVTHEIRSSTKMKLQGISKLVKVSGIQQIKNIKGIDFANANILNTPNGYYVAITCYEDKNLKRKVKTNGKTIGIDFGCQTSLTYSDGTKQNISFEESDRLKILQRKLSKKTKRSNRRDKLIRKIGKQYQHMNNKKIDISNKIVHGLKQYDKVIIQDEQLSKWMRFGHGKKISHGCLGLIKSKLMKMDNVVVLDKYIPTTKLCTSCGNVHDTLTQYDRTFICPKCGSTMDRDVHAA